jgi:hypothetical protein
MALRVRPGLCVLAIGALLTPPAAGQKPHVKFAPAAAYESGPSTDSVAVADLRGNGHLDLITANYCETVDQNGDCTNQGEGGVSVLLGNGDGTFQAPMIYGTRAYFANSLAVVDVNGDHIPDLIVANSCGNISCEPATGALSVLLGNGDGTFRQPVVYNSGGYNACSVAIADLNGDGRPDLAVSNQGVLGNNDGAVSVLLGNGDGTFQPALSYELGTKVAASIVTGDLNGDGVPDLVVANYGGGISVLLGNGDGTLQPAVNYGSNGPASVALVDLRSNGLLDVIAAVGYNPGKRPRSSLNVLLGNGNGTLGEAVTYLTDGVGLPSWPAIGSGVNALVVADVNGDGIPDAVSAEPCQSLEHSGQDCVGNKDVSVLLGNGDGTFQSSLSYTSDGFVAWGIAVADVNGDGRPDLVVANYQSAPYVTSGLVAVLLNETYYASKTALISSPSPTHVSQAVTFTATVTPTPPNGEVVTFLDGKTNLGTSATKNGVASLTASFPAAKTYTIKASYVGDAFRKKSSGTVKLVVNP